jgi:hypothetical protein
LGLVLRSLAGVLIGANALPPSGVTKALRTGGGAEKIAVDETALTAHEIFMNFEEAVKLLLVTADYEPRNDGNFSL